jgi:hypothetical protein
VSDLKGERMDATLGFIRMPTGGADFLQDGDSLDAGTAHHIDSNLSHLVAESQRHWVSNRILRIWGNTTDIATYYDNVAEGSESSEPLYTIAWSHKTALQYGPFPAIIDRALTTPPGGLTIRRVRVKVDVRDASGPAPVDIYAALTSSPEPPTSGNLVFAETTLNSSPATATFDLDVAAPMRPREVWRCRSADGGGSILVPVVPVWLWVGRHWVGGSSGGQIRAVSAYEVPADA